MNRQISPDLRTIFNTKDSYQTKQNQLKVKKYLAERKSSQTQNLKYTQDNVIQKRKKEKGFHKGGEVEGKKQKELLKIKNYSRN